jgi:hypothetical protein
VSCLCGLSRYLWGDFLYQGVSSRYIACDPNQPQYYVF